MLQILTAFNIIVMPLNDKNPEVLDQPMDWALVVVILIIFLGPSLFDKKKKDK